MRIEWVRLSRASVRHALAARGWVRGALAAGLAVSLTLAAACEQELESPRRPRGTTETPAPSARMLPRVKAELLPRIAARIEQPGPVQVTVRVGKDGRIASGWAAVGHDLQIIDFDAAITEGIAFDIPAAKGQTFSFRFSEEEARAAGAPPAQPGRPTGEE